MINWQLSDFTVQYPDVSTKNFQTLISAKKEFNDLASNVNEPVPLKGQPYNHQKAFIRFMSVYENMLVLDSTGTGKGPSLLFLAEHILSERNKFLAGGVADMNLAHFKRTIILVKSKSLMIELKNQLVNIVAPDRYNINKLRAEHANNPTIKAETLIKREIEKWYEFHTYETFAKKVKEYENDLDKLNIEYDHSLIIIDEAHNLFIEEDDKAVDDDKKKGKGDIVSKDSWNKEKTYYYLWLFMHQVRSCKKVLASATPMLNGVEEIGKILNLLISIAKQLPLIEKGKEEEVINFYKNITVEELEEYVRGITTFVRAFDAGATRIDRENPKVKCPKCPSDLEVFMCKMSEFQTKVYKDTYKDKKGSLYGLYLSTASNFAYPDGAVDNPEEVTKIDKKKVSDIKLDAMKKVAGYIPEEDEDDEDNEEQTEETDEEIDEDDEDEIKNAAGFKKYVIKTRTAKNKREATQIIYKLNEDARPKLVLNSIEDLQKYSCKYAAILTSIKKHQGSRFIYGKYNESSGNIILSLCLEKILGFTRYMETDTIFVTDKEGNKTIKKGFKKAPRYALLTGETIKNDAAYNSIKETMNSYENRHGEYIQCIIASRVARDGLNFKNIIYIDLIGPEYNPSAMYQAISRGIRTNSHNDLLEETKDNKLDINVYKYAAIPDEKIFKTNVGIDINIYEIAKEKEIDIEAMMIKLKQCTINCQINFKRNVREGDKVTYKCVDPPYDEIDYSTYNAYYLMDDVLSKYQEILPVVTSLHVFSFEELYDKVNEGDIINKSTKKNNVIKKGWTGELVSVMLEYIMLQKIPVLDRYGFVSYLYKDGDVYYIDREYDAAKPSVEYVIYQKDLIAVNDKSDVYVEELNVGAYEEFTELQTKELTGENNVDIEKEFEKLSVDNKIKFLEEQFIKKEEKYKFITDRYDQLFFEFKEIKVTQKDMGAKGRGRPKKEQTALVECGNITYTNKTVYINLLYLYKETKNYNFMNKYVNPDGITLRIYTDKEIGWRNCTDCERGVYLKELIVIKNRFNELNKRYQGLFGVSLGGVMRIVYNPGYDEKKEDKEEEKGKKNIGRDKSRGKECSSFNDDTLNEMAHLLKIDNPTKYGKSELCKVITNKLISTKRMF